MTLAAINNLRRAESIGFLSFYDGRGSTDDHKTIQCRDGNQDVAKADAVAIVKELEEAIAPVKRKWASIFRERALVDMGVTAPSPLETEAPSSGPQCYRPDEEKARRIYYQDIVYSVCNQIDKFFITKTQSGTSSHPSTEVQERMAEVAALAMDAYNRRKVVKLAERGDTGVWVWGGDGQDYPESLTCPILISADNMRLLIGEMKRLRNIVRMMIRNVKRIPASFDEQGDPSPFNGRLWSRVSEMAGLGSESAKNLCREFGEDPDLAPTQEGSSN